MADKPEAQQQQQEGGGEDHISTNAGAKEEAEEAGQDEGTGGLLSGVGDPLGKVLNKGLRPIGYPLEKGVTGPLGEGLGGSTRGVLGPLMGSQDQKSELLGGNNADSYENKKESIAGKEQTGDNPLGLDQTGRWGFREE